MQPAQGLQGLRDFLKRDPERLTRILATAKKPLSAAAAVNATRTSLVRQLRLTGLPVETSSGGRTKWNRCRLTIPKSHALDAACTGTFGTLLNWHLQALAIKATGRGFYQRTRVDGDGFPRSYLPRTKRLCGFQTGELVRAIVTTGKKIGQYTGRVAVRSSGSFNIQMPGGTVEGIAHRFCRVLARTDGYTYSPIPAGAAPALLPARKGCAYPLVASHNEQRFEGPQRSMSYRRCLLQFCCAAEMLTH